MSTAPGKEKGPGGWEKCASKLGESIRRKEKTEETMIRLGDYFGTGT